MDCPCIYFWLLYNINTVGARHALPLQLNFLLGGIELFDRKLFKNFDYTLLIIVLLLVAFGIMMITSATSSTLNDADKYVFVKKQVISFAVGLIFMTFAIAIDYNMIGSLMWYLYGFNIFILLLVKVFGADIHGAKSWIQFGSFSFQPSEISKVIIIVFLAKFISSLHEQDSQSINSPKNLGIILGLVSVPILLIALQPDFGTNMVIVVIIVAMLYAAKLNYKYFLSAFLGIAVMAPIGWFFVLKSYQKDRIKVFLNPDMDPLNRGFQVIQSKIAIGSGMFSGKGLFQGTQTQMGYLPFKESDFIFSVIGEEMGFIWSMVVLLLFGFLLLKLIDIARNSRDFYGSLIAIGIAAMIGIHVFQNIGMTIGLMPVTGIPLSFISYGGSSLIANMIGIGLVLNISMRRQKITF